MRPTFPYVFRLGVSGHRKLEDHSAINAAVERVLDYVASKLTARDGVTGVEWVVVSPLALGADRVVAEVVLSKYKGRLEVVTPMKIEEYRKDFDTPKDLADFERLFAQRTIVSEPDKQLNTADQRDRDLCYLHVGERVGDLCELLIVIWNGQQAAGIGGTGDAVAHALLSGRKVIWIDSTSPQAQARLLRLAKHGEAATLTVCSLKMVGEALPIRVRDLSVGYVRVSAFNHDTNVQPDRVAEAVQAITKDLLTKADKIGPSVRTSLNPAIELLVPLRAKADELADAYQFRHRLMTQLMYLLSAVAVTIPVMQLLFHLPNWLILLEVLVMLSVLLVLRASRKRGWHDRWLYSRYLAELFRVATYTVPFKHNPARDIAAAADAVPFYAGADNWISASVAAPIDKAIESIVSMEAADPDGWKAGFDQRKRFTLQQWIADQRDWHGRNAHRKHRLVQTYHWIIVALFLVTLLAASFHFVHERSIAARHIVATTEHTLSEPLENAPGEPSELLPSAPSISESSPPVAHASVLQSLITLLAIVIPAWAAAIHGIRRHFEDERVARRSEQMYRRLAAVAGQVELAADEHELRPLIASASRIMTGETYEWLIQLSFSPPELVV